MTSPSIESPAGVDPAFTAPERPALFTQNIPADGEVAALLADRDRLRLFLVHGLRLWRRATARTWVGFDPADPAFGQKSNELARQEWLDHYQWLHTYGPTLLLLVDQGLLEGAADRDERATRQT